jgi:hypothetical protein
LVGNRLGAALIWKAFFDPLALNGLQDAGDIRPGLNTPRDNRTAA